MGFVEVCYYSEDLLHFDVLSIQWGCAPINDHGQNHDICSVQCGCQLVRTHQPLPSSPSLLLGRLTVWTSPCLGQGDHDHDDHDGHDGHHPAWDKVILMMMIMMDITLPGPCPAWKVLLMIRLKTAHPSL